MLRATAAGFRIRTVGANPSAAESAGRVNVPNVVFGALVLSGAMSGLGGATLVMGQTYALFENISSGLGYTAIAVALLARLNPVAVIATGLFFGALETGAAAMQRDAGVPSVFVLALEAIVVLGVLFADSFRNAQESVAAVQ
jgi:simple sugar transport system permease protein